jgi:hypothetical protein
VVAALRATDLARAPHARRLRWLQGPTDRRRNGDRILGGSVVAADRAGY